MEQPLDRIEKVWNVELEILDVIHQVCMAHNLRYSLAYGTLLGAVRHGDFIPWDDDIDIIMPREDYEKLLSLWADVAPSEYLLQNNRTNPDFTQNFSKIRKNHTAFVQDEEEIVKNYHKGIFVDIFPGDRVASGMISKAIQFFACAVNLLYSRGHTSAHHGIIHLIEKILLATDFSKYIQRRETAERWIRKWNSHRHNPYLFANTLPCSRKYYPADLFDNLQLIEFSGRSYWAVKDSHTALGIEYGDYMQLPPEEERVWKHHPIIIDFEHNYEEIENEHTHK